MKEHISRRNFLSKSTAAGLICSFIPSSIIKSAASKNIYNNSKYSAFPIIKKGEKQLFVDNLMIESLTNLKYKAHPAKKLDHPVIEADMPWEQAIVEGVKDRRVYIYGTVLRDETTGKFKMWYNRGESVLFAVSNDGINWEKPLLGIKGDNNMLNLRFHSPSIIKDKWDPDPNKRYKAVGSSGREISKSKLQQLKDRFESSDWYKDKLNRLYYAAYSADGIHWTDYPEPILLSADTVTMAQDPLTGEYLVFHKREGDPRVKGRQIFLSTSKDMLKWSEPKLVLQTDEIDHKQAKQEVGGTHSEFYNLSAFPYGSYWLGLVTQFRVTGPPKIKGPGQSGIDGPVDVQLVHSRDGRHWERCMDRSPVIPIGPYQYDRGTILGVCNSPVIVDDEMWMYYAAMTTTHAGAFPDKEFSIGLASWRIDGMVSLQPKKEKGVVETVLFYPEGDKLFVNADVINGQLKVEALDNEGTVLPGFDKHSSEIKGLDGIKLPVRWDGTSLPKTKTPIQLKFYLANGDLYSYTIE